MKIKYILAGILSLFILAAYASQNNLLNSESNQKEIIKENKTAEIPAPKIENKKPEKLEIKILPSTIIKQGQTILVEVHSPKELVDPKISFNGQTVKLYKTDNDKYRGIVGLSASSKIGNYKLGMFDTTKYLNKSSNITVTAGKFPIQNIVITGKKSGLEPEPGELAKIEKAKNAYTSKSYWSSLPFNSPTKGCIVSVYGLNRYYNGKPSGNFHKGVDIVAPNGEVINTITGGKVTIAENLRLHGGTVAVNHGQGLTSIYIHMSKIYVKPGQILKPGQAIGEVGATGFATGPHLHWGLYVNGVCVDPMKLWIKPVNMCK